MSVDRDAAARAVHEALRGFLDDGEIAISWCVTIDVAGADDVRYLAHRSGGGLDGTDAPTMWAAVGMIRSSLITAEKQVEDLTRDTDDDDEDDDA